MLSGDIETVDRCVRDGARFGAEPTDAWLRIKTALVEGQKPTTNNRMLFATQINHALKNMESDEQRLDFLSDSLAGICCHCGAVTDICSCHV